jgi:hypothetical protein
MAEFKHMYLCQMCGAEYHMGAHRYDGKHIPRYNLDVCKSCYESNWDGWAPHYESKLVEHLRKQNLPLPERNEKGWYPRD